MFAFHAISELSGGERDGIHLIWSPPFPTGHSLDGFTIERRVAERRDGSQCFTLSIDDLDRVRRLGVLRLPDATVWATPREQKAPDKGNWTLRCDLVRTHVAVDIVASLGVAAFAARADGKVVDGCGFSGSACHLRGADIAIVWVVVKSLKAEVRICGERRDKPVWDGVKTIVKGLQMPFRAADPGLATLADEQAHCDGAGHPLRRPAAARRYAARALGLGPRRRSGDFPCAPHPAGLRQSADRAALHQPRHRPGRGFPRRGPGPRGSDQTRRRHAGYGH